MAKSILFDQESTAQDLIVEHWLIGEGDQISSGQPIVTVRGDSDFFMIRSPYDGFLLTKKVSNGESFNKKDVLGEVVTRKEAGEIRITDSLSRNERKIVESLHRTLDPKKVRKASHIKATPSARQEARKYNISLESVLGTGPDGRIQVKDIHNHIRRIKEQEKAKNTVKRIAYGLPATPLARRLAKKYDLDLDKIPAPPGAVRLRKKDVERFLRSPESAAALLEEEYITKIEPVEEEQTVIPLLENSVISSLPEPKPQVIRLSSEKTPKIPSQGVIELDQKVVLEPLKLNGPRGSIALQAPEDKPEPVIRLTTDVPLSALSDGVIQLRQIYKVDLDKLMEPENYLALKEPEGPGPIRLTTSEISEIPSESPIPLEEPEKPLELPGHTLKDNETLLADFLAGDILSEIELDHLLEDQTIKNILALSSSDHSDLTSLYFSGPKRVISFTDRVKTRFNQTGNDLNIEIVAKINKIIRDKIYDHNTGLGTLLIKNLTNPIPIKITGTTPSYLEKEIKLKQSLVDQINVNLGEVYIVDLLDSSLTGVSGIVSPEEQTVIYLTKEDDTTLKLKLEFSTENLSEEAGLELIQALKQVLEDKGSKG